MVISNTGHSLTSAVPWARSRDIEQLLVTFIVSPPPKVARLRLKALLIYAHPIQTLYRLQASCGQAVPRPSYPD